MKALVAVLVLLSSDASAATHAHGPMRVNGPRIVNHLEALSEYGKNPQGGVSRIAPGGSMRSD